MVPGVRLELTRFYPADFESAASTIPPPGETSLKRRSRSLSAPRQKSNGLRRIFSANRRNPFAERSASEDEVFARQVRKRDEHEKPSRHSRMRTEEFRVIAHEVVVEENVEIKRSRSVHDARGPHAPVAVLQRLQAMENFLGIERRFSLQDGVHVVGARGFDGRGVIERTQLHIREIGRRFDLRDDLAERREGFAQIGPEGDRDERHQASSFLLTLRRRCGR